MNKKDYDFAGFVTKNDTLCSDGVVIKHGAFQGNDDQTVPLVWNHDHSDPMNVLGKIILHSVDTGVYGYGQFNDTPEGRNAKLMVQHGDISAMSIAANRIKRQGQNVVGGKIFEVSLVLAGANPGALIETVMNHSDDKGEEAIIYPGTLIHSSDDVIEEDKPEEEIIVNPEDQPAQPETNIDPDLTVGDVLDTLDEQQMAAVEAVIGAALDDQQPETNDEGDEEMAHNVFEGQNQEDVLMHSDLNELLEDAKEMGSWKAAVQSAPEDIQHSITNIETLFPDAKTLTDTPFLYKEQGTSAQEIVSGIRKSPFSRVKTIIADLTDDQARAKGYIKGKEKLEQVFDILHRETVPQTVYKKQKLDRDDIVDITDFDIVNFVNGEMRVMLDEEIARAALVGDGRASGAEDKIKEVNIRPIFTDDDMYTIKKTATGAGDLIDVIIKALAEYQGSGQPSLYLNPALLADFRLLKDKEDRYLFGDIPSPESMAARLGVSKIVSTTFLTPKQALVVNLSDYTFGATKGGEVTTFDDFDIDFNQYKYLIETRLSGALATPKSAIAITIADAPVVPSAG